METNQLSIPDDFGNPQGHSTDYSLQDTSQLPASVFIRLRQEVGKLKKENAAIVKDLEECREKAKYTQRQLVERICTENDVEKDLRSRLLEAKKTESELKSRIIQLEDTMKTQTQISELENQLKSLKAFATENKDTLSITLTSTGELNDNIYSVLKNLTVEAQEDIDDIQNDLILDEDIICNMSTDRVQKLVRDTENYERAKEKVKMMKVKIRNELGNASKEYPEQIRKSAEEIIEELSQVKMNLDETLRLLENEANERKIKFSKLDTDMSKFYQIPMFRGEGTEKSNIFEFFKQLSLYLEATSISPDEHGAVLKHSLRGTALNVVNKAYPNTPKPPMEEVKSLLIRHFGKIENILSSYQTKHEEIGKIPDPGAGDMNIVYKKSSDHACHIQKALMLEDNGCQVIFPESYIDTIERILPPTYKDKYLSYEISNESATPRQKLEMLFQLVNELEVKSTLKSSTMTDEDVDEEEENVDEDDESVDEDDYYDAQLAYDYDESDQEEEESDQEEEEPDQEEEEPDQEEEEPDQEEEFDEEFPKLSYHYPVYTQEEEYEMEENREDYVEQTDTTYSRPTYH